MTSEHPSKARLLLALDRELDAQEAARVADHLRGCAECRATCERLEALSNDVERYCRTWPSEHVLVASARLEPSRSRTIFASVVLAAAAAVLLLIGAWIAVARSSGGGEAQSNVPTRAAGHDIALETQTVSTTATKASMAPPKPRHRFARASTSRQTGPTYYWALPYSNDTLPLSEGSLVMRVRLSREQLQLAGIPLAGIPIGDSHDTTDRSLVRAKVLVGADGLPRAISFEQD